MVASHKSRAHADDTLTLRNTDDDTADLSDNNMSRKLVERWKNGPGRRKAWKRAPFLSFAKKDGLRLLRCIRRRKAIFCSQSMPLRNSELFPFIKQTTISFGIPIVMSKSGMVDRYKTQTFPKLSAVKKLARQLGLHPSNGRGRRIKSKPFSYMPDSFIDGDEAGSGECADDEENDSDSFEQGSSHGHFEGELLSGIGSEM